MRPSSSCFQLLLVLLIGAHLGAGLAAQCSAPTALPLPAPTPGQPAVAAGGWHSLFLDSLGTVYSCGRNDAGQLGLIHANGSLHGNHDSPWPVPGLTDVVAIVAGMKFSLALRSDGTVWAWGSNNTGQLGLGMSPSSTPIVPTPTKIPALTNIVALAAGTYSAMAIDINGSAWAWGSNINGMLGIGSSFGGYYPSPFPVSQSVQFRSIALGDQHSMAVDLSGNVWVWGDNNWSQLGPASAAPQVTVPTMIPPAAFPSSPGNQVICAIAANAISCFAATSNFKVWSWGGNGTQCKCYLGHCGPLYNETATPAFVNVSAGTNMGGIHHLSGHAYGLSVLAQGGNNTTNAWGLGCEIGALIGGSCASSSQCSLPLGSTALMPLLGAISAGGEHCLALDATSGGTLTGQVRSWGSNQFGQLGRGGASGAQNAMAHGTIPNFNLFASLSRPGSAAVAALRLLAAVDSPFAGTLTPDVRAAGPASGSISFTLESPNGTLIASIPVVIGELFPTPSPPVPLAPFVWPGVNLTVIYDGTSILPPPLIATLPASGLVFQPGIPSGLAGLSFLVQGAAITSLTPAIQYVTTAAQEIRFM